MSTLDPTIIIRAGGLVPTNAKISADVKVGTVAARRYSHEAIPGRTVVRLVPDAMAPGADIEMDTLGFGKGEVSATLGKGRLRALGFPGWALINDPARASFALEVMKDFKKAAKQIRSKPGNARDAFLEIGARLSRSVPHFLPSFWEEAGRRFLAEESTTFAAQSFEKARLAEKEHALKVDEDTRSAAYLEFALAGAVAAKSLTGYAKELQEAYGAETAYARYLELATRRVLGGMPPWTGLAKELRGLAKAAKKNLDAEDEAFMSAILDAPAIARSPGELWTTYDAALVRLAAKSPALKRRLRHLFPQPTSQAKDFETWWFSFLERANALEGLWEPTEGEPELAEWLSKMIRFTNASPALYALLPKLAPRLIREGKPVQVSTKQGRSLSVDFAETLLELGASVAEPNQWMNFNLTQPMTVDPVRIQADPVLGPKLLNAVETALGNPAFEAAAVGKVGLSRARRAWLEREVGRLSGGGLFGVGAACARLTAKVRPALWAEHPDLVEAVKAVNVADALARTLRGGVFAEYTWPAFEELQAKKLGTLSMTGAWPFPVFHTATKAIVLGAIGTVLEHDFVLPPKASANRSLYVDGDLFVIVTTPGSGTRAYWASNPHELFDLEGYLYWYDFPTSVTLPEGGATLGDRAIHRGDRDIKIGSAVNGDGTGAWISGHEDGRYKLYELDPKTGTKGRASWPKFMTEMVAAEEQDKLRILGASFAPAPPGVDASPLGQKDGVVGLVTRGPSRHETGLRQARRIDGGRWERQGKELPLALLSWPGDNQLRAVFSRYVSKPNGGSESQMQIESSDDIVVASLGSGNADATGWPAIPHVALWCYLRPRDEAGSKLLRAVDVAAAERVLEKGALEGVTAPALVTAIAAIAKRGTDLRDEITKLTTASTETASEGNFGGEALNDRVVQEALGAFLDNSWSASLISEEIIALSEMALGGAARRSSASQVQWQRFVGRLRGVALFAMLPGTSKASRETIAKLLRVFAPTVFAAGKHKMRVFSGQVAQGSLLKPTGGASWTVAHEGSTFALRVSGRLEQAQDAWRVTGIELRSDDKPFLAPAGLTIGEERTVPPVDDTAFLSAFVKIAEKDPPAWDPAAAEAFSTATGLTRGEATLILAGLPNLSTYASDFLGKELREKLGLKTSDAKMAKESVRTLPKEKLLEAFARGAPEDPNDLVRPWSESALAARLGKAFAEVFGSRVTVREEIVTACERELDPPLPSTTLLAAVASENVPAFFHRPPSDFDSLFRWQNPPPNNVLSSGALTSLAGLISWLYLALPAGDAYRDAVPRLMSTIDKTLADPDLVLPLRQIQVDLAQVPTLRALMDTVVGEPAKPTWGNDAAEGGRDSGGFIAGTFRNGQMGVIAFRPGKVGSDDPIGRALANAELPSWGTGTGATWNVIALLRSPGMRAIVDRIDKLDKGAYEANPSASIPALVAKVAKATKLSEEAACHYLQLLALPEPTSKSVQLWNGWKPAQYKKTCDELLAKKLVVSGKRERAGREIFLPGAWEKGQNKGLPMEGWKKALYPTSAAPARILPARPLPEIFTEAWKRIEAGDVPKLEEV